MTSRRQRTRDRDEIQQGASAATVLDRCPECEGTVVVDEEHGERVCEGCGLIIESDAIDRGPEWRAFDAAERDRKSRVGAPATELIHDKGLSTNIGWQDKDAYGRVLNASQRKRVERLRTWNERYRTRDSKDRNLKQALGEIDRMASALGLPEDIRETASVMYRRALDEGLLPGRSIEGVATAVLYGAARQAGAPRSLDEFDAVSRVEKEEVARTYRYVTRELNLAIEPADPEEYVPRFASELDVDEVTEHRAHELLRAAKRQGRHSGKSPVGLAAAAIYAAGLLTDEKVTQGDVSEVTDISEVTIRNRYHELLEAVEAPTPA